MNIKFMKEAIKLAQKAYEVGEVPVGAVIVKNNKIIARSYNKIEKNNNVVSHAEINVIQIASRKLNNWRLIDCDIYVTLEPCPMCEYAIKLSRIKNVYFCTSRTNNENIITNKVKLNYFENECIMLLKKFFKNRR